MARTFLPLLITLLLAGSLASAGTLEPTPIPNEESTPSWKGPQFVQADRGGNVFFFRAETFEVYPVTKAGTFGEPVQLETTVEAAGLIHDAILSPAGDQWLVYADFSVRRFVNGKEKLVPPLEWNPWAIGFRRDTPVVAVIPRPIGRFRDLEKVTEIPWLLTLSTDRWDTFNRLKGVSASQLSKKGGMNDLIAENAVRLASDREGKLWAARQYACSGSVQVGVCSWRSR